MRATGSSAAAIAAFLAAPAACADSLLLIPDSQGDKVWAFSAWDGALVSNAFIPNDGRMKLVMQVAQTPQGTLLMTDVGNDQSCTDDAIREYSPCGQFLRTVAGPADGVCNPEGITIAYGKVWFTRLYDAAFEPACPTCTGQFNALWSMNFDGTGLARQCTNPTFGKIWSLCPSGGGFIVGDSADNNLEFSPASCVPSAPFYAYGGGGAFARLPQQIGVLPDGTVMAAFFAASQGSNFGVYFFSPTGELQGAVSTPACRGVHPLGNGEILCSGGTQVVAYNPVTGQFRTIVNQVSPLASFRWISPAVTCRTDLNCSGRIDGADLSELLSQWGSAGSADFNGSGNVDGADLSVLLASWGPCAGNP